MIEIKDHSSLIGTPIGFFSPKNVEELSEYLLKNKDFKFRIGAGLTGVSGAAVPTNEEVFIDFSKFKSLVWIDKEEGVFSASAGNTMLEIKNFVESEGWNFPVLPGSMNKATLGGMIACNGGGPYSLKYGKIGNLVREIEVVGVNGEILNFGSVCKKISEGPDFSKLFMGSEGTLGFISKATLSCVKLPEIKLYRISHPSFSYLLSSISVFLRYNPVYLEMAEPDALRFSSKADESVIWLGVEEGTVFNPENHLDFCITKQNKECIKERFDIGFNLQEYKKFIDLDISFPLKQSTELLVNLKKYLSNLGRESVFFGHAGDGNWHIHVFYDEQTPLNEELITGFDDILFKHGGHISGEHGIGRIHKSRFKKFIDNNYKLLYLSIKAHLDPSNKLPSLF
jgi:glycolate oxidase